MRIESIHHWFHICIIAFYYFHIVNADTQQKLFDLVSSGIPTGYFLGDDKPICWVQPHMYPRYQINDCASFNMSIEFLEEPAHELLASSVYTIKFKLITKGSPDSPHSILGMYPMMGMRMHANVHYCNGLALCVPFVNTASNAHNHSMGTSSVSQQFVWNSTETNFSFDFNTMGLEIGDSHSMMLHVMLMTYNMSDGDSYRWDIAQNAPFTIVNPMEYHFYPEYMEGTINISYVLTLLTILGYGIWCFIHRRARVVVYSQPIFLYLLLFGAMIYATSVIPASVEDTIDEEVPIPIVPNGWIYHSCMVKYWMASLGFAILYGTLFSKMYRAFKVVTSSMRLQPIHVDSRFVITSISLITLLFFVLMLVWQVYDPLITTRVSLNSNESALRCVADTSSYFIAIWYGLQLVLLFGGCVLAYLGFGMNAVLNESRFVALVLAFLLQTFLTTLPIMFVLYSQPSLAWALWCAIVLLCSNVTLGFVFIPKIIYVHSHGDQVGDVMRNSSVFSTVYLSQHSVNRKSVIVPESSLKPTRFDDEKEPNSKGTIPS